MRSPESVSAPGAWLRLQSALTPVIERRWLFWCLLLLVPRLPFYFAYDFLNVDEAAHLLGAQTLLTSGQRLYVDFVDNKPPLIYAFYAPAVALLPSRWAMLGVHVTFLLGVVLPTVWALASCFNDRRTGTLAGAFYLLLSGAFVASDGLAANTEQAMLLPLSFAVKLSLDAEFRGSGLRQWIVGVLLGLAALGKQPALLVGAALLFADERIVTAGKAKTLPVDYAARAWMLGTGALVPLTATALMLQARGGGADAWYWIVEYNLGHVKAPLTALHVAERALGMLLPLVAAWLPAVILPRLGFGAGHPRRMFLSVLVVATLLPAFLGARFFGHYFLPALYAATLLLFSERSVPRWAFGYAGVSSLGFCLANVVVTAPASGAMDTTLVLNQRIGSAIKSDPCAGPLFVWGYAPQLYAAAGRKPATRFVVPIDTISGFVSGNLAYERGQVPPETRIVERHRQQLLLDLARRPPAFIVDTSGSDALHWRKHPLRSWPTLSEVVGSRYEQVSEVEGVRIFRRKSCLLDN